MEKVRIGIIGFGRMGITHYSIINTHPAVEMTAIADTSGMILNMIKKYLPGVKMFEDYKDLLNSGLVDAVIICTRQRSGRTLFYCLPDLRILRGAYVDPGSLIPVENLRAVVDTLPRVPAFIRIPEYGYVFVFV